MRYLSEFTSKKSTSIIAEHRGSKQDVSVNEKEDGAKVSNNFHIARQLTDTKTKLVEVLSIYPVTALWLIDVYEQYRDNKETDQEDEAGFLSGSMAAISEIKKNYDQAHDTYSRSDRRFSDDNLHLTKALRAFPFSFYDLTGLVDVIVYFYKFKSHCFQPAASSSAKIDSDLVAKRLGKVKQRANSISSKFLETVKTLAGNHRDAQFLFLDGKQMHATFTQMVAAEHQWLNCRERLATANSRLVLFIANQYKGGFLEFDDLVQEGQTGLLKAVDRYDYRLGYKFSTYAGYWIRQAISRALSRCERVVRIPCGQVGAISKVFRAREQLVSHLGKEPSVNELSEFTGISIDEIDTILSISQSAVSIENSSEDEESVFSPIDFLEQQIFPHPFGDIAQSDLENLIVKALKLLNPREAKVICGHFGVQFDHEMTLKEIGNELNLTRERVRQIQVAALNKIKLFYGQQLATCL